MQSTAIVRGRSSQLALHTARRTRDSEPKCLVRTFLLFFRTRHHSAALDVFALSCLAPSPTDGSMIYVDDCNSVTELRAPMWYVRSLFGLLAFIQWMNHPLTGCLYTTSNALSVLTGSTLPVCVHFSEPFPVVRAPASAKMLRAIESGKAIISLAPECFPRLLVDYLALTSSLVRHSPFSIASRWWSRALKARLASYGFNFLLDFASNLILISKLN